MLVGKTIRNARSSPAGLTVSLIALALLSGSLAPAMTLTWGPRLGSGPDSIRIAMINDPHVGHDGSDCSPGVFSGLDWYESFPIGADSGDAAKNLSKAVDWLRDSCAYYGIKLLMVDGDLTQCGKFAEAEVAKGILDRLTAEIPYVPLIGNHDVWPYKDVNNKAPRFDDSVFADRCFAGFFDPQYELLASRSGTQGYPLRNWQKCPYRLNTFDMTVPSGYADFQCFAFDIGPDLCPYHIVCLDFNDRCDAPNGLGVNGVTRKHDCDFNDRTSSVLVDPQFGHNAWVKLYAAIDFSGDSDVVYGDNGIVDLSSLNNEVSSVRFGEMCNWVTLFDGQGGEGDKIVLDHRLDDVGDSNLCLNGSAQWWQDHIRRHAADGQDHTLIFAHHPLVVTSFKDLGGEAAEGGFDESNYGFVAGFLDEYRQDIGGWFGGHLHDFDIGTTYSGIVDYLTSGLEYDTICHYWIGKANFPHDDCFAPYAAEDPKVQILTLYYDPANAPPVVDLDRSGLRPSSYDPTEVETAYVHVAVLGTCNLTAKIRKNGSLRRTICTDSFFLAGDYDMPWVGTGDDGKVLEPGEYTIDFSSSGVPQGGTPFAVKGCFLMGCAYGHVTIDGSPLVLGGDVVVPRDESLRIDAGVHVMSAGNYKLRVLGRLAADGAAIQPILFTPHRRLSPIMDTCSPGRWQGIRIEDEPGACCSLDHCIIEYAGNPVGGDSAAIVCKRQGGLSLTNSVVRYSSTRGFWARSSINNNEVLLRGDTFEHITGYPASVLAESVGAVVNSCTFRNNQNPALDVRVSSNDMVDQSANWLCCEPGWRYDIDGQLYVHKPYGPSCCSLFVSPGVTIRMGAGHKLEIGVINTNRTGYLGAWSQGEKIAFTSLDTLDPDNWWEGIQLSEDSRADLENCVVAKSAGDGIFARNGATVQAWFSDFRGCEGSGIHSSGAGLWLFADTLRLNEVGVQYSGANGSSSRIQGCIFAANSSHGLLADGDQYVYVLQNTFENNGIPVRIRANLVYRPLLDSNWFPANTWRGIEIGAGANDDSRIDDYAYWCATPYISTYRSLGDLEVLGPADDGSGGKPQISDAQHKDTKALSEGMEPPMNGDERGRTEFRHQDTKNTKGIGESGLTTEAHRHEEEAGANRQDRRISDAQYEDTKSRSRPDFPSSGWDFNYRHVPTPMEWARAHGVGEDCVDSLLPATTARIRAGVHGFSDAGRREAALPQAGGGKGPSLNLALLALAPGCTLEFEDGTNCLRAGDNQIGFLIAAGQPNNKVTFRCAEANGQWDGIHLKDCADWSILKHCRILGAGHSTSGHGITFEGWNPRMERCEIADCEHRGIYIHGAAPRISRCYVHNCGFGVYLNNANNNPAWNIDSCTFAANTVGIYNSNEARAAFHYCNVMGNGFGAYSEDTTLDCMFSWWNAPSGPEPYGLGDSVNGYINWGGNLTGPVQLEPPLDAAALWAGPVGRYMVDSLLVMPWCGIANNYDDTLAIPVRIRFGTYYQRDSTVIVPGNTNCAVGFPQVWLPRGKYQVVGKTMVPGDVNPANDSVADDSLVIRRPRDVAPLRVVEPSLPQYCSLDTIHFAVMVISFDDTVETFPVKFWRNDTLQESTLVVLAAEDSCVAWFSSRVLAEGMYHLRFATCLAGDEYPVNDSMLKDIFVRRPLDVAASRPLTPSGVFVGDPPVVLPVMGWVKNLYDEPLTVPARMRVGDTWVRETQVWVPARDSALASFSACPLDTGHYRVSLITCLPGDRVPANDSIADSVYVRRFRDVAVTRILAPLDSTYTIEDSIPFGALVANRTDETRTFPVRLLRNDTLVEQENVEVAAQDSLAVWFDTCRLRHGDYCFKFVTCLDSDERRGNDTLAKTIRVKSGDYWVFVDSSPEASARLCWSWDGNAYAAARNELRVDRFDVATGDWSRIADPPVSAVYGITAVDSAVYVIGTGGQADGEVRNQKAEGRRQNGPKSGRVVKWPSGRVSNGEGPRLFSTGPALWRYVTAGDSWVFETDCDSTLELGEGTNIVGDQQGSIYLIGAGESVQRYFLAQDSWASIDGSPSIDHYGAASWMDGRLYAIASDCALLRFDENGGLWNTLPGPLAGASFGSALACDPAAERIFAFWDAGTAGRGYSELRDTGGTIAQAVWIERESLASETLGAAMCFGTTQGYCLDGRGGFWRYRPQAVFDVAAIDLVMPETAHADTPCVPVAVVQNNWEDSLSCQLLVQVGSYTYSPLVTVPPQSRVEYTFGWMWFAPGTYQTLIQVSMSGPDSIPANDRRSGTLFVPLRHDAAAVEVLGAAGAVRYDSLLHPAGVIANNWSDSLDVRVMLAIDSVYLESTTVRVPSQRSETIWFDTCRLSIGWHETKLGVGIEDDEYAQNDTIRPSVNVVGNGWLSVHSAPTQNPVLCDGDNGRVYAADRYGSWFNEYHMLQDSWSSLNSSPVMEMISLSRVGCEVFGLGIGGAIGGCIERYRTDLDQWTLVTNTLPVSLSDACGLVARDPLTLYLVGPGWTSNFWRYDVVGDSWHLLTPMPGSSFNWVSCASDRGDRICVLTGPAGQVYQYQIGADNWTLLTTLPQSMTNGPAALSFDVQRGLLPAMGGPTTGVAQSAEFSLLRQTWSNPVMFLGFTLRPSLAVSDGRLLGTSGGGSAEATFAEYVRVTIDVAALDILALPDTFRSDSVPQPGGVVRNLSWVPVTCQVALSCGTSQQQQQVQLAPMQYDTVWFGSMSYPPGRQMVNLTVSFEDGGNPRSNVISRQVFVRAPWVPCASSFIAGRLDSDTSLVFAADRQLCGVMRYHPEQDQWECLRFSPFMSGCLDLAYWNGSLYALGGLSSDRAGKGPGRLAPDKSALDQLPYAMYRLVLGDTAWQAVCESLPDSTSPGGLIATGSGLYVLPASGKKLLRYDSTGWTERAQLPNEVVGASAVDWDRLDTLFFTFVSDSGAREFLRYSVTGDTWLALTAPPESGLALAVEPGGNRVLMMTLDSLGSALFEYDRTQDTWTRPEDAPPQAYPGMALCFAEDDVWLMTGGPTQWSTFWRYDPDYQGGIDRKGGLGGTAGWTEQLQKPCLNCEPNPFNKSCRITYALPKPGCACLKLYDVSGRLVMTLANGHAGTGKHVTNVSSGNLAHGIYLLKLESADYKATRKLILE